jgi:hypothetical protein
LSHPSWRDNVARDMDSAYEGSSTPRFTPRRAQVVAPSRPTVPEPNSVSASAARAARRREARRDEQAVSAWLRELAARGR